MTQALICVPGIISVTYDLKNNFCLVRGKRTVAPEVFGRAVATQGIGEVYLVRKNEKNEEVCIHNFFNPTFFINTVEFACHLL